MTATARNARAGTVPGSAPVKACSRTCFPGLSAAVLVTLLAGCVRFQPQQLSPGQTTAEFDSRSLTNAGVETFLATNHLTNAPPQFSWDLHALTLVAYYYHPDLPIARAQLAAAQAGKRTAGERPNPSVSVTPGFDSGIPGNPSPWVVPLTFDVPIETAWKRGKRIAQARHLSEAARWNLVTATWQVRSRVRSSLLNLYAADQTRLLLAQQETAQSNVVRLLEGQLAAGGAAGFEVTQARIPLNTTRLARQEAFRQYLLARTQLASALGLPLRALEGVRLSFAGLNMFPASLIGSDARREALLNRADLLAALEEYAASQSALQLEIAKQYPDVRLGPGFIWNAGSAGDSEWQLGLTVTLPVLNHNQGAVAEAKARREETAARFRSVQAQAIAEVDGSFAAYDAARQQAVTAVALSNDLQKRLESVRAMREVGEVDSLTVANAQVELSSGELARLDALVKAQQALGQLEDAVQRPVELLNAEAAPNSSAPEVPNRRSNLLGSRPSAVSD